VSATTVVPLPAPDVALEALRTLVDIFMWILLATFPLLLLLLIIAWLMERFRRGFR